MNGSNFPPPNRGPEAGLRRLDKALAIALSDREAKAKTKPFLSFVDFSELYGFAFRTAAERPAEDFLGGRFVADSSAAWMLQLATEHLFTGWDVSPLRLLPPHRAEMARELRRLQEEVRAFRKTHDQLVGSLPAELRDKLGKGPDAAQRTSLLRAIMRGQLSTLCMELLDRQRNITNARRCFQVLNDLVAIERLALSDTAEIADYQPAHDELVLVEDALAKQRRAADSATNATDARALLYLREAVLHFDGQVRFATRSPAARRTMRMLTRSGQGDDAWAAAKATVRAPEGVLLDFLAGPEQEGTDWLGRLRVLLEHFLAQVDRAYERARPAETELVEITQRAWASLIEMLNVRRSTRADAPELLLNGGRESSTAVNELEQIAEILLNPQFQAEADVEINRLLGSIERAEWQLALTLRPEEGSTAENVPVRISREAGSSAVTFVSGSLQVALHFVGEIQATLQRISAQSVSPATLTQALVESTSAHGAEAYLLVAVILASANRWQDALLYCDRTIEALGNKREACEAHFLRGLSFRKTARGARIESETLARDALQNAKSAVKLAGELLGSSDPRYLKELGTIIVIWVDLGLPDTRGWRLTDAIRNLETARADAEQKGDKGLLLDTLNNLCYAYALCEDQQQLSAGMAHVEQLEALAAAQAPNSAAIRDTVLLLTAREARVRKDLVALEQVRTACEELVAIPDSLQGSVEARRRHLAEVSSWCAELSGARA